ncbi:endonuclease V [Alienimonas californiensis]|uniref:Endonuclease V n=1 Tax=Alienimonas californiensis TaxID=2527989 RepID=A0A517P8I5_9PLAN|nr:endonuclease V [Alienimonas californiensis]QDT15688.1 Endonuclease V [Alienimonas californiensis]
MHPFALTSPDLTSALAALLRTVPAGRATTFGDLAGALGAKSAAVWVGTVCRRPPDGWDDVPTWRAVRASGECVLPGQAERLRAEGAPVEDARVELNRVRYADFPPDGPLHALKTEQDALAERVVLQDEPTAPGPIGAVDVAYPSPGTARAAYVEMTPDADEPTFSLAVESAAPFPYVSGFLTYRELPAYAALTERLGEAGRAPALLLVDGNGILHPRLGGVACGLGVLADVPTIGVAKKQLCGAVREDAWIELAGEVVGARIANPHIPRGKPVFVSPGHRVTVETAVRTATSWFRDHRLPEPLWRADRLSKTG